MKIVFNFSHPTTQEQYIVMQKELGQDLQVREFKVQLDLNAESVGLQVDRIIAEAMATLKTDETVVAIIPPSLPIAAYFFGQQFTLMPAIWLRTVPGETPLKFVIGGIE